MVISVAELDVAISVAELEAIELWETSLLWQHTSVHYSLVALIILLETVHSKREVFIAQWLQLR